MKKISEMTMAEVITALNESVDKYNGCTSAADRLDLDAEHKQLVQAYNDLSLLSAYAECMKDQYPVKKLAEVYYYDTISTKDSAHKEVIEGKTKITVTRSVAEGCKKLNVQKFVEWAAERNAKVTSSPDWKVKTEACRKVVEDEWKKFFAAKGDSHAMSIGKTKKAVQAMFDELVFIPSESGKNAIIANGDIAKWILGFANSRKDSKVDGNVIISGAVLPKSAWSTLQLDVLHKAVTGKSFDIFYGDEGDSDTKEVEDKPADKSKSKAKTEPEASK